MAKAERRAELISKIRMMAESRQYARSRSIEAHLVREYPEVHTVMQEAFLPKEIDLACQGRSVYDA